MRQTSHFQSNEPLLEYLLREMRYQVAKKYITKNSCVADLGCGYHGNFLTKVASKIRFGEGYDVAVAKKGLPKNIVLKKANLNKNIGNRKNYFDYATALAVLEHVENPKLFLKKIKVLLKAGGQVIITTPHKRGQSLLEFLSFKLGLVSKDEIRDHKNYFDEKGLKKILKILGFKIIKIDTFEFGLNLFCVAQKIGGKKV